ncbi:hypothetical protein [Mycobacteroides abscessus]|uniref:hypothetical protein n=1 Tax=Mycobacteroides abscessus TaxID=36809 RepID=UPI000C25BB19|nr:hypothetical protein [Mycobacteroides abscessus]
MTTTSVRLALGALLVLTGIAAASTLTTTPAHRTVVQADACTITAACAPAPPAPLDRPRDRPVVIGEDDSTVTVRWEIATAYARAWDEVTR